MVAPQDFFSTHGDDVYGRIAFCWILFRSENLVRYGAAAHTIGMCLLTKDDTIRYTCEAWEWKKSPPGTLAHTTVIADHSSSSMRFSIRVKLLYTSVVSTASPGILTGGFRVQPR